MYMYVRFMFYASVIGAKGSENDRWLSWRWRERSTAFLQEALPK